ncbi:MAG: glucokinase [Frankiaceae bacterium]|nr:glucokinase [Frankiaceae bacterium]MDQ1724125.1 glucokinase [Frankiaceae bacterium]
MGLTIGVDVGGTKLLGGVVDDDGNVLSRIRKPTPGGSASGIADSIADLIEEARQSYDVSAVGIGVAGFVSENRSTVRFAPNLALINTPLRDEVAARVGLPVVVENDANAAAWGEYRYGAGRGHSHIVLITLGTGVGGGFVFGGKLYRGGFGVGAEIGHVQIVPGGTGRPCGCGQTGCLEMYVSGRALGRHSREAVLADPVGGAELLAAAGGDIEKIEGPMVTLAAQEGNALAIRVFAEVGALLGQGFADIAASLDPTCFVVGGGVCLAGDILIEPARKAFAANLTGAGHRPLADVRAAVLGNDAGLIGAADLARQSD